MEENTSKFPQPKQLFNNATQTVSGISVCALQLGESIISYKTGRHLYAEQYEN